MEAEILLIMVFDHPDKEDSGGLFIYDYRKVVEIYRMLIGLITIM